MLNDELLFDPRVNGQEESTKRERIAWYMYDWANSVYSTVGITGLLPILVAAMAASYIEDGAIAGEYPELDPGNPDERIPAETGCVSWVTGERAGQDGIGGTCIPPASLAAAFISISSIFQFIVFVTVAPLADYGSSRKKYFIFTGTAGAFFTFLFYPLSANYANFLWVGWNIVISNVFFGVSIVFYNSFLATIVVNDPRIKKITEPMAKETAAENLMNQLSGIGLASGFASGVILLVVCLGLGFTVVSDSVALYRLSTILTALWWFGFGSYSYKYIIDRPLPPMPENETIWTVGVNRVKRTISRMPASLPNTGRFMIAWFVYSDGMFTITQIGALFASEELKFGQLLLLPLLILVPLVALFGNFFFLWVYRKWDLTGKQMIVFHHWAFLALPLYLFLGFIPGLSLGMVPTGGNEGPSTLSIIEMYLFGAYFGLHLGSVQSFSRTAFADLVPPGLDAEFFGLYEMTDKGSSWMGPLAAALINSWFGSMRYAMFFILFQILVSLFILTPLDVVKGRRDAKAYALSHHTDPGRELSKSLGAGAGASAAVGSAKA